MIVVNFINSVTARIKNSIAANREAVVNWLKTHRKVILWAVAIVAVLVVSGVALAALYATNPTFRAFVQSFVSKTRPVAAATATIIETATEIPTPQGVNGAVSA